MCVPYSDLVGVGEGLMDKLLTHYISQSLVYWDSLISSMTRACLKATIGINQR